MMIKLQHETRINTRRSKWHEKERGRQSGEERDFIGAPAVLAHGLLSKQRGRRKLPANSSSDGLCSLQQVKCDFST